MSTFWTSAEDLIEPASLTVAIAENNLPETMDLQDELDFLRIQDLWDTCFYFDREKNVY